MKRLIVVVLCVLLAGPAWAQQSIVEHYRNLYPTPPGGANIVAALKGIAAELNRGGIRYGVLLKPGGERCLEPETGKAYACDIICTASGQFDVFEAADGGNGAAIARWNPVPAEKVNWQGGCEFVAPSAPPPVVTPPPPPQPPVPPPPAPVPSPSACDVSQLSYRLDSCLVKMDALSLQLAKHEEESAKTRSAVAKVLTDAKTWIAIGTGFGTWLLTRLSQNSAKPAPAPAQ